MNDPRNAESEAAFAASLADGRCPYGGGVLSAKGNVQIPDGTLSCQVCDCFGFDPEQATARPAPLEVVRWKVVRRVCGKCGSQFAAPHCDHSTICTACLSDALGLLTVEPSSPFDVPAYFDVDEGPVRLVRFASVSEDEDSGF